jgi:hypothetical protein
MEGKEDELQCIERQAHRVVNKYNGAVLIGPSDDIIQNTLC